MKLWVDDIRPAPDGYVWCKSVLDAVVKICDGEKCAPLSKGRVVLLDIDHDAGDYVNEGGDYIKLLDWLEATDRNYPIHIHSMNPVGVQNMRAIIEKNGWTEV